MSFDLRVGESKSFGAAWRTRFTFLTETGRRLGALVVAFLTAYATSASAQSGLTSRQPIGAYLNGVFPSTSPGSGGGFLVEDAFPGVTFFDPIKMVQEPRSSMVWVITRQGQVWRMDKNAPAATKTLLLDLGANTLGYGDSGLLGIALHPDFGLAGSSKRGYIYLWYNYLPDTPSGSASLSYNRLSRFTLADGATSIARSSELVMINQFDEHEWHNGGDLFFGADSFLYVCNGDEGDLGEIHNNAQKINGGLFSGVLRIDVNQDATRSHAIRRQPQAGGTPPSGWPTTFSQGYFIPNDNPWVDPGGSVLEEFYAIGLRSPHRMTFDSASGKAIIGDVGQDLVEEVDVLAKGANYQWSYREGTIAGPKPKPAGVVGTETAPIYTYPHGAGSSCVIGGYVYRGSRLSSSTLGQYIFGDYVSGKIWSLDWQTPGAQPVLLTQVAGSSLAGFSVDSNNEIYLCTLGRTGQIFKLSPSGGTAQPPATLSATGTFTSLANLTPRAGVVPFNVNAPLWTDGAAKLRWIAVPNDGAPYSGTEVVTFSATGSWGYPVGTVLIKHFDLPTNETNASIRKRMETRFLVRGTDGWYGVTYKWRADGSDADLMTSGENMSVTITTATGTRTQNWTFPGRGDCMNCHTTTAGSVLGPSTRQLNGNLTYTTTGITANQLATWNAIGMFDVPLSASQIAGFSKTVPLSDTTASLEARARSYLDSNCAHCHRPGGVRANWDARFDTALAQANIINGPLFNDAGIVGAKVVVPRDIARSMMHIRLNSLTDVKMPPLAKNIVDTAAVTVIAQWINSLSVGANTAPVITQPSGQATQRGTNALLQILASDVDGNSLTFSATGLPLGLSINPSTGLIIGTVSTTASATNNVTVSVSDGALSDSKSFAWTITDGPPSQPTLTGQDVGAVGGVGSTTGNSGTGTYTLNGSGSGIFGTADAFQYAWVTLYGDGEIKARVTSQTNTNPWAKAGVMMRESLTEGSRHAVAFLTPENGFGYEFRATTDQPSEFFFGPASSAAPNNWLKMTRVGDVVTGYASADGQNWTLINAGTIPTLQTTVRIGLVVTASSYGDVSTATFDNVQVTGQTQQLTNEAPVVVQPAAQSSLRGVAASLQVLASDFDGNTLTYSATGLPAGLAINATTGFISGTVGTGAAASSNVIVTASDGVLADSKSFVWTTTTTATTPPTLTSVNVGVVGLAGSTSVNATTATFTISGSGEDIFFNADGFRYAYRLLQGDGEISARVTSQTDTNPWAKAGVMIRENLTPGSRHAMMLVTPQNGFGMVSRTVADGPADYASGPALNPAPYNWVKLVRAGNELTGYASADGQTWTPVSAATITGLSASVSIGLAVTSTDNLQASTATFDNVRIVGSSPTTNQAPILAQPANQTSTRGTFASLQLQASDVDGNPLTYSAAGLPAGLSVSSATGLISGTVSATAAATNNVTVSVSDGSLSAAKSFVWTTAAPPTPPTLTALDIGATGLAGSSTLNSTTGVFTVRGAGDDIFFNADAFQFDYRQLSGDGEIRARVTSQTNTNPWAKAGVMIRENLTAGSRHAMMMVTPANGFGMVWRAAANGVSDFAGGPVLNAAPNNWVRLVRAGDVLTGYSSLDGAAWAEVFAVTLTGLPANAYIGLAVTATDSAALSTATFDNVQIITGGAPVNQAPVVAQPANQSTVRGAAASLQISASDPDGNALTYSASGLPSGLTISITTGLISGTVSTSAAATNNVTVSATDGTLSNSKSFTWTTIAPSATPTLTAADVGATTAAGTTTFNSSTGVYTIASSGEGIAGAADSFHFARTQLTGDGEIKARVTGITSTNPWAKAGVMIREDLTAGARFGMAFASAQNGFAGNYRVTAGGLREFAAGPVLNATPNNWVRMVRAGGVLSGYVSANGTAWTQIFTTTLTSLSSTVYFGLAVTESDSTQRATATFDNVQIIGGSVPVNQAPVVAQPANQSTVRGAAVSLQISASDPDGNALTYSATGLPAGLSISTTTGQISGTVSTSAAATNSVTVSATDGTLSNSKSFTWTTTAPSATPTLTGADVGATTSAGTTTFNSSTGVYTIASSGEGIAGAADSFHFARTQLTGDGEIKARVTGITSTNPWAKAGVMIREDLTAGARFGMAFASAQNGFAGNYRVTAGGVREFAAGPVLNAAPNNWVRMVRAGGVLSGYVSANGTAWTQIFTATLTSLSSTVYFGLAVTESDSTQRATATFDNVQIIGGSVPVNQSPVVAQPANQSTVRGAAVSLQISASDPDGNALTYSATGLPSGLSISTTTGLISGTVSTSAAATNNVTVNATDGTLSNSKSFTWTTTAPNATPTLTGADVGVVTISGGTVFNSGSGVYTLSSSGIGIAGTADAFQYASAALTGDGEIKARVSSLTNTNAWSKAGVMIREDLSAGARFGMVFATPQNGFGGNYRLAAGALREYAAGPALNAAPNNWVRVVRSGGTLTGHASADGATWTQVFSVTLANLAGTVRVGLAVTSTDNSQLATATFDNVQIINTPAAPASQNVTNTLAALESTQPAGYPSSWSQWIGTYEVSTSNADGDYNSDLMEYATGEDPASGVVVGGLHLVKGEDGRHGASFRYPTRVSDLSYEIETSADLTSWTALQATPITTDDADAFRTVTYAALDGLLGVNGGATVFIRLRVMHRASGAVATGEPLSLQRIAFAAGNQTLGHANVNARVFAGLVSSVTSDAVNLGAIIAADTARHYYLEVRDGSYAGHRFDIASFSGTNVGVDLSSMRNTAAALPDLTGASVVIRPHVTLDDVLDKTMLIGGRSASLSDKVSCYQGGGYVSWWLFNLTPADPTKAIWVSSTDATLANAGSRIIAPGEGLFLKSSRNTSMITGGSVRTNSFVQVLRPGQSFIAQPFPLAASAASSGFDATNGFVASRVKTSADQLLVWRGDSAAGSASFGTLWYAQIGAASYWTSADDASLADQSGASWFLPHRAVFLKRSGTTTTTALVPVPWSTR